MKNLLLMFFLSIATMQSINAQVSPALNSPQVQIKQTKDLSRVRLLAPDLTIADVVCESLSFYVTVKNQGGFVAPPTRLVAVGIDAMSKICLDRTILGTENWVNVPNIPAGKSIIVPIPIINKPDCGNSTLNYNIILDSDNKAKELDETNNCRIYSFWGYCPG